jgi:hypothetical protein
MLYKKLLESLLGKETLLEFIQAKIPTSTISSFKEIEY